MFARLAQFGISIVIAAFVGVVSLAFGPRPDVTAAREPATRRLPELTTLMAPGFDVAGWPVAFGGANKAKDAETHTTILRKLALIPHESRVAFRHSSGGTVVVFASTPEPRPSVEQFYSSAGATPGWTPVSLGPPYGSSSSRMLSNGDTTLLVELRERSSGGTDIVLAFWK